MSHEAGRATPPVRRLADWDDRRLRRLAGEYGTPVYVLDLDRVAENAARLRGAFPEAALSYAAKANTTRAVLRAILEAGFGLECATAGEVRRGLDAGFAPDALRYTAVNPPAVDLDRVVEWSRDRPIPVTVGAEDTLDRLRARGYDGPIHLRVNPALDVGHHAKVRTGTEPKFGLPMDRVPAVADEAAEAFDLVGLHAHAGSGFDDDDLDVLRELVERLVDLADRVDDPLDEINVGGGFGVPYREDAPPLDLEAVAATIAAAFGDREERLAIEPGRYLVADAGVLLTRVTTVKETPATTVIGVDAGMTDLLRPALYDAYHAIRNLAPDAGDREPIPVEIAGPICESADVFARDRPIAAPARGDTLGIGNAGAYGYEMASQYNSRPRPAVVACRGDRSAVVRERETLDDLVIGEREGPRP